VVRRLATAAAALAALTQLVAGCASEPDLDPAQQAKLARSTQDYERCVVTSVQRFRGPTQAYRAAARAVEQSCRLQRERVREALADEDKDDRKEYMDTLDALTLEVVRRTMSRPY
jgi:hypothetical protein